jgi:NADH-quinone oxidoreductase subunit N
MYNKESNEERTGTPFVIYAVAVVAMVLNIALCFSVVCFDLLA